MNSQIGNDYRSQNDIIKDLERMTHADGFVYTFCYLVLESIWIPQEEIEDIDWFHRLNSQELSFLLGLMVKRPLNVSRYPSSVEEIHSQASAVTDLMEELHKATTFLSATADLEKFPEGYTSWLKSGTGMVEPIFYGGDGAYDFQYLEMAEKRYVHDKKWIKNHLGIGLEDMLEISRQLKQLSNNQISGIQAELSFAEQCEQILAVFLFGPDDIQGISNDSVQCFLQRFTVTPGTVNENFHTVGEYNVVHSHPILRLDTERYFLPIYSNLPQSIYESPYYWMMGDKGYKAVALGNRGNATEEIAHELLAQVFGEQNVYRNVKVTNRKQDVTDIDVLAVAGNKAVIVQAKSKKLTERARRGDGRSLQQDFKGAIQRAYEQALLSREAVLDKNASLTNVEGLPIDIDEAIDDAYIVCVTGDHYPAVTTQLKAFLEKKDTDPYPIAISIFDLDIVSFYLSDPFELLYYLRQRSTHATYFISDSEMSLLGFHLSNKLFPAEEADAFLVSQTFAQLIDANFPAVRGQRSPAIASDALFHEWKNEAFERLIHDVKSTKKPGFTDALFLLYDLAGSGADGIMKEIEERKRLTLFDDRMHDASFPLMSENKGITFLSFPSPRNFDQVNLFEQQFIGFSQARKHKAQADEWLAIGSYAGSARSFDLLWYSKDSWKPDSDLDKLANLLLKQGNFRISQRRKIGRNAPCFCESGLKFKRCHGK